MFMVDLMFFKPDADDHWSESFKIESLTPQQKKMVRHQNHSPKNKALAEKGEFVDYGTFSLTVPYGVEIDKIAIRVKLSGWNGWTKPVELEMSGKFEDVHKIEMDHLKSLENEQDS